jgi:hypothetical protein
MAYTFNPFTGTFDNAPSTLKGDNAYSNLQSNSATWVDAYDTGTVYKANSASYATIDFANNKFFPLTGGQITGNTRINGNVTIFGDLTSTGTQTFANTIFSTTSSLSVVHVGSGPAVWVGNNGSGDIASFNDLDQGIEVFHIGGANGDFPNVGVKTSSPNKDFTVNGEISASNTIWTPNGNSGQWNSVYSSYNTASASLATNSYVNSNFLPLSGGTMTGKLNLPASTLSSVPLNLGNGVSPTTTVAGDVFASGNNIFFKGQTGGPYIFAYKNDTNTFLVPQIISTVSPTGDSTPALRITQAGAGNALVVEDSTNPDSSPFIVNTAGSVGIGLSSLQGIDAKLTVVGNISSAGVVYASGGNSDQWNSVYSTVLTNSATNWNYQGTDLKNLSSGWVGGNDAYTNLVANSAAYLSSVDLSFLSVSADWNSVYNTVQTNSATNWNYQGTDLKNLSANWESTYSTVSSLSSGWLTTNYLSTNNILLSGLTVTTTISASGTIFSNSNKCVTTIVTDTPGTSAISTILAVSALPLIPDSNILYIVI